MADGDNLILGMPNQSDSVTLVDRAGTPNNTALIVRNSNGSSFEANATGVGAIGVLGGCSQGTGVVGRSNGPSPGVGAESDSGAGIEARSKSGFGVLAVSTSNAGVQAIGGTFGVLAVSRGDIGVGVQGVAVRGVQGFGSETGVFGQVNILGGGGPRTAFVGVHGNSNASHGVFGVSSAAPIPSVIIGGVTGVSNQNGVVGESTSATDAGVFGRNITPSPSGVGVLGVSRIGFAGAFSGDVIIVGNLYVTGRKSAALPDSDGQYRTLYAVESPESWFEDFGSAKLVRGRVRVEIKKDFGQFIYAKDYHVFLSPEGPSNGLYVEKKSASGFDVVEQGKGRSNIRFSYRIVAKRRDLRDRRLEVINPPDFSERIRERIPIPKTPKAPTLTTEKRRRAKG